MNKLGFTYKQVGQLYFGMWADLYEIYKMQYNFEMKKSLYDVTASVEEKISSLDVL